MHNYYSNIDFFEFFLYFDSLQLDNIKIISNIIYIPFYMHISIIDDEKILGLKIKKKLENE